MAMRVRQVVGDIYIADRWYTVDDTSHLPVIAYEREGVPPASLCAICGKPFSKHGWISAPVDPDQLAAQYDPTTGKAVPKADPVNQPPAEFPKTYTKAGEVSRVVTNTDERAKAIAAGFVPDVVEAPVKAAAPAKTPTFPKTIPAKTDTPERADANGLPVCPGMYVLKSPLGVYSTCKASEFGSLWAETN